MDAATYIVDRRTVAGTRSNYRGKLNTIAEFIDQTHPELMRDDKSFEIPLPREILEELFGWLSTNTDLPKLRGRVDDDDNIDDRPADRFAQFQITISPSTTQGYRSALLWYYAGSGIIK